MSCNLTSGRTLACRDSIGGMKEILLTELANKNTLSTTSEGLIDAFSLLTGKQFWRFELVKETSDFVENIQTNEENGTIFYETDVNLVFNKRDVATRNQVKLMGTSGGLMGILRDNNGTYWLAGEVNGLFLQPSKSGSGKAFGDRNGYELVFKAKEPDLMKEVDSSLIATLLAAAA